jgi:outer membrane protein
MKKIVFAVLAALCAAAYAPAQQLTRFAVVDLARVHSVFFLESGPARQLEQDSAAVQAEINRMSAEIQALQSARIAAVTAGEQMQALQLEEQIRARTEFLREFHAVRTAELESRRRTLIQSDDFLGQIYSEIRFVAERDGFTMVLDINTPGILWFSPIIDITNALIQSLLARRQ